MHLTSLFLASRGGGSSFATDLRGPRSYLLVTRSIYSILRGLELRASLNVK
jgi:hypothetical protein